MIAETDILGQPAAFTGPESFNVAGLDGIDGPNCADADEVIAAPAGMVAECAAERREHLFERFDELEVAIAANLPDIECPVLHQFTPGLYARTIFMPAGTLLTSKIHKTEHPYVITKGAASVWIDGVGWQRLEAGHRGVTKPGTRRILYIHEDCEWTTFHPTNETDVDKIEETIIETRRAHLDGIERTGMFLPPGQE